MFLEREGGRVKRCGGGVGLAGDSAVGAANGVVLGHLARGFGWLSAWQIFMLPAIGAALC